MHSRKDQGGGPVREPAFGSYPSRADFHSQPFMAPPLWVRLSCEGPIAMLVSNQLKNHGKRCGNFHYAPVGYTDSRRRHDRRKRIDQVMFDSLEVEKHIYAQFEHECLWGFFRLTPCL